MCTYNGDKHLKEQLDSILNQTYPLYEIIIQDDCSCDGTWDLLQHYQLQYPLIKCFQNEKNIGYSLNFLSVMYRANGDYIAFADQDDYWMPNKIDVLVSTIKDKSLAISQSTVEFPDNRRCKSFSLSNPYITIEKLIFGNVVSGHSCMINSSMLKIIKKIDVEIVYDYLIALIAYSTLSYEIAQKELQVWRRHENAASYFAHVEDPNQPKPKDLNKWIKVFYSSFCLFTKIKHSIPIKETFRKLEYVLQTLTAEENSSKNLKCLRNMSKWMSNQTLLGYIIVGLYCVKLRNEIFPSSKQEGSSMKNSIARVLFAFRFPFTYWYDNHLKAGL